MLVSPFSSFFFSLDFWEEVEILLLEEGEEKERGSRREESGLEMRVWIGEAVR